MMIKKCSRLLLLASLAALIAVSGGVTPSNANAFEIVTSKPANETLPLQLPFKGMTVLTGTILAQNANNIIEIHKPL